ncbi:MAG: hypothetical protein GX418_09535 [Clostridiales bacterium]|nr:hypothetical protein [Clostridiales bacterium]
MSISEELRKLMMAGLGAASVAAEKTQEAIDTLAKRGEEALEQGKVLNERLRHEIRDNLQPDKAEGRPAPGREEILRALEGLSPEDRAAVGAKLTALDGAGKPDAQAR